MEQELNVNSLKSVNDLEGQINLKDDLEFLDKMLKIDELPIFRDDGYLVPFKEHFLARNQLFVRRFKEIVQHEGNIIEFAHGYKKYGFQVTQEGISFKEWAPGAKEIYLIGEFNNWDRRSHKLTRDDFGNWSIFLARNQDGTYPIKHMTPVKIHILNAKDQWVDRIPAWIHYLRQKEDLSYEGMFLNYEQPYQWRHPRPQKPISLKIYECHVGMAGIEPTVHSYKEFTNNVLPRVKKLGYNCIQLMAVMEHSYYGSFGYHVSNFFAIANRSGETIHLQELIDTAHGLGIYVLLDIVHSHASSNAFDGLGDMDGTGYQYFHEGERGNHELWDSKLFDYSKWEVLRFLLSNICWYLNEYKFDGFRFDGITSMLYHHHGLSVGFSGGYHEYFSLATDLDAVVYLMLANYLTHKLLPTSITIAEDVSGMPTLGRSVEEGGVGFDYRLAMAVPDKWIKLLKEHKDEEWNMADIVHTLTNRRWDEKCVAYAESHDQALVGDKTISMWLFDSQIYYNMGCYCEETLIVHRGIALHKMIRLITIALGGEAYLTFMGNEFGHPEWIDFPREGNNFSYNYARRQWDLAERDDLRYKFLQRFDEAMIKLDEMFNFMISKYIYISRKHEDDKVIAFEKDGLLFVFNFHPFKSFEHYRIGTDSPHNHIIVLDTDDHYYGGHDRLRHGHNVGFPIIKEPWDNRQNFIQVYIPSRTAIVLRPLKDANQQ